MKGKKIPYLSILLTVCPTCFKHCDKSYSGNLHTCAKIVTVYIHFMMLADGLWWNEQQYSYIGWTIVSDMALLQLTHSNNTWLIVLLWLVTSSCFTAAICLCFSYAQLEAGTMFPNPNLMNTKVQNCHIKVSYKIRPFFSLTFITANFTIIH
jgi:hypothetical protein